MGKKHVKSVYYNQAAGSMEACSEEKTDLDLLIDDFQTWQKVIDCTKILKLLFLGSQITTDFCSDNKDLKTQLYYLQKQCQLHKESEKTFITSKKRHICI